MEGQIVRETGRERNRQTDRKTGAKGEQERDTQKEETGGQTALHRFSDEFLPN